MKRFTLALLLLMAAVVIVSLAACDLPGRSADPCAPPQISDEVEKIHQQMRAFDDTSKVISNTPRNQINDGILKLQAIRRDTEDLNVPYCLLVLKTYAVGHMNAMIDTLLAFVSGAQVTVVNYDLAQAQLQHEKYFEERARLLGTTYTPEPTITPFPTMVPTEIYTPGSDACSPTKLPAEVERVNNLMRAFDDWSSLALNTPKQGLSDVISNLQSIRRQAQDLAIPECLTQLKQYQLAHMETVINTLLSFLSSSDSVMVNQGILLARSQHDQYNQEYARLLGLTIVPAGTPLPQIIAQAQNTSKNPVNIRRYPVNNADILAEIKPGNSVALVGKSLDGAWVAVFLPDGSGNVGWVSADLLQIPDLASLPEMTPIP